MTADERAAWMTPPPELVRGCDSPEGICILADWLDEHGGDGTEWHEQMRDVVVRPADCSDSLGYPRGDGSGSGNPHGFAYGTDVGDGVGRGDGCGDSEGDGAGEGPGGNEDGDGSGIGRL